MVQAACNGEIFSPSFLGGRKILAWIQGKPAHVVSIFFALSRDSPDWNTKKQSDQLQGECILKVLDTYF